jgi:putative Mg2+ transporter-C (MgtC) family protein
MSWSHQLVLLGVALALSSIIGLERGLRQKSAGLRTHTLVGVGAAVFVLVSKYGFSDVVSAGTVNLDPSRVAAQVVSGIGFIGAGLIFVKRAGVRGLITAAAIWLTAAVGMAAGAGLIVTCDWGDRGPFARCVRLYPTGSRPSPFATLTHPHGTVLPGPGRRAATCHG